LPTDPDGSEDARTDSRAGAVWVGLIALAAYLATLHPGPGGISNFGDSAKFQYLGTVLGLSHPPGAPLYILLTALWVRLPIPIEPAVLVNAFSALCGAGTLALTFAALRRLGVARWAAVGGMALLAVAPGFWEFATEAELYVPALLFSALALERAAAWTVSGRTRDLALCTAALSLGIGIHPMAALPGPAVLVTLFAGDRRRLLRPASLAALAGGALVGALPFAYIVLRADSAPYSELAQPMTWDGLVDYLTARRFEEKFETAGRAALIVRMGQTLGGIDLPLPWTGVVLGMGGIVVAAATRRAPAAIGLALGIGIPLAFVASYDIADPQGLELVVAWPLAIGTAFLLDRVATGRPRWVQTIVVLGIAAVLAGGAAASWRLLQSTTPADHLTNRIDGDDHAYWDLPCAIETVPPHTLLIPPWGYYGHRQLVNYYRFTNPRVREKALRFAYLVGPAKDWNWAPPKWRPDPIADPRVAVFEKGMADWLGTQGYRVQRRVTELGACPQAVRMVWYLLDARTEAR
jgi:hypothetical protein